MIFSKSTMAAASVIFFINLLSSVNEESVCFMFSLISLNMMRKRIGSKAEPFRVLFELAQQERFWPI